MFSPGELKILKSIGWQEEPVSSPRPNPNKGFKCSCAEWNGTYLYGPCHIVPWQLPKNSKGWRKKP